MSVLIPSSSGRGFRRETNSSRTSSTSLNPFFIRAWVQTSADGSIPQTRKCLNPFFIRAWVQTEEVLRKVRELFVLIPSSSGHGFRPHADGDFKRVLSLNPFFVRAWVQTLPSTAFDSAAPS